MLRTIRKLWKVLAGTILLLIILIAALYLTIDSIAKAGIEAGGRYALGVDTRVDSVSVSLLQGELRASGIEIDNPKGYTAPLLMRTTRCTVDVKTGTLFSQVIEVPLVEIDGIEVNIEIKGGTNNVSEVADHIKSLGSGEKKEGGRRVKIDTIVLTNVTANVLGVPGSPLTVKIPRLELKNVTEGDTQGILAGELVARLFPAVIAGVLEKGKGIIPSDLAGQLASDVAAAAKSIGEGASKLLGQAGTSVGEGASKLLDQTGKTAGKAVEGVKDAAEDVGNTIDDIFGKKKDN